MGVDKMKRNVCITHENVTEHELHEFSAEASELRLSAGEFPANLITTLGNRQPFIRKRFKLTPTGDIGAAVYTQSCGNITLTIWND